MQEVSGRVIRLLKEKGMTVTTVESCTGGMVSSFLTDIPGASEVFKGSFVTYSDETKHQFVGVKEDTLKRYTAVSEETAREMVQGGTRVVGSDLGVSVTGYAGPDGGENGEPAGLVYIGCGSEKRTEVRKFCFQGNRGQVRRQAALEALRSLEEKLLEWENDSGEEPDENVPSETIRIKYFTDRIEKLCRITEKSDWIDLRAAEDVELKAGEFRLIPLGVAMELPAGYEAHVIPRSSTFKNFGILQVNSMGLIDESYCGDQDQWYFPALAVRDTLIRTNDRICQFRIVKHQPQIYFEETSQLSQSNRGGFGSTGKQ